MYINEWIKLQHSLSFLIRNFYFRDDCQDSLIWVLLVYGLNTKFRVDDSPNFSRLAYLRSVLTFSPLSLASFIQDIHSFVSFLGSIFFVPKSLLHPQTINRVMRKNSSNSIMLMTESPVQKLMLPPTMPQKSARLYLGDSFCISNL